MTSLVIWDYDGTIAYTHEAITYSLEKTFRVATNREIETSEAMHLISLGLTIEEPVKKLDDSLDPQEMVKIYREIYQAEGFHHERMFVGVEEVIQQIASLGIT